MKPFKVVRVGDQVCSVETLRDWLNNRITQIRKVAKFETDPEQLANLHGRSIELLIIREKLNDGRIREIG